MEGRGAGGTDVMIKLKSHEELRSKLGSKSSDCLQLCCLDDCSLLLRVPFGKSCASFEFL